MSNKELTIEDLGSDIKYAIENQILEKDNGRWYIRKLQDSGFSLRIFLALVEEDNPINLTIIRKPVCQRPAIITVSGGFTAYDFNFFQINKIFPPHEPPMKQKKSREELLLSALKTLIAESLGIDNGGQKKLLLKKIGAGLRINLSAVQEKNPRLNIKMKIFKNNFGKADPKFSADDLEFLKKNGLIGF